MNNFVIPKILDISRHTPFSSNLNNEYKTLSRKVIWGNSRKSEPAITHLARPVSKGGLNLPKLIQKSFSQKYATAKSFFLVKTKKAKLFGWQDEMTVQCFKRP